MALTAREAKNAKYIGPNDLLLYDGRNGLYLRVRPSSKTWIIRKKQAGKRLVITLGKYPALSVKEARIRAFQYQNQDVSNVTVKTLAEKYLAEAINDFKRPELVTGYFNRAILPAIGHRKVRDISRAQLVRIVQDYTKRGARTADSLRSNLKKLFGYAVELGYINVNPMNDVSRRVAGYTPAPRDRVLSDDEMRLLWAETSPNARLLRFLLLTGLRISEAQKGHRDGDKWIVPKALSKNKRGHWVHLTTSAAAQLPFPLTTPTNVQAWLRRWCEKHGINPRFTPHDLRRTAATRMADNTVEPFIVERVLNHTLEGVMAVYNRAEYEAERIAAAHTLESVILGVVQS